MILLDTDHFTILRYTEHPRCAALTEKLAARDQPVATTVITFEEQMRGWLAEIRRQHSLQKQVTVYERLDDLADSFRRWKTVPFDTVAAHQCERLKKSRIRIGTQDLKIAAIALVNNALLLSANLRDFKKVPGLRVENWLA